MGIGKDTLAGVVVVERVRACAFVLYSMTGGWDGYIVVDVIVVVYVLYKGKRIRFQYSNNTAREFFRACRRRSGCRHISSSLTHTHAGLCRIPSNQPPWWSAQIIIIINHYYIPAHSLATLEI